MPGNRLRLEHRQDVLLHGELAEYGRLLRQIADPVLPRAQIHGNVCDVLVVD